MKQKGKFVNGFTHKNIKSKTGYEDRDRKNPHPLEHYQKQASGLALPHIQKTLELLQDKEKVQKLGKLLGLPLL